MDIEPVPTYPVLQFIAKRGGACVAAIGVLGVLAAAGLAVALQAWLIALAGVVGTAVLCGLLASYVELVRVVKDTLIPR